MRLKEQLIGRMGRCYDVEYVQVMNTERAWAITPSTFRQTRPDTWLPMSCAACGLAGAVTKKTSQAFRQERKYETAHKN